MPEPATLTTVDGGFIEAGLMEKAIRHSNRRRYFSGAVLVLIGLALGVCLSVIAHAGQGRDPRGPDAAQGRKDHGPDVYARLYLPREVEHVLFQEPPLTDAQFERFRRMQVALLRGRTTLAAAVQNEKVKQVPQEQWGGKAPVAWLEEHLRVEFPDDPEIAQVGLDGDDHKALKTIITAVVDAYLSERQSKEKLRRQERLAQLKELRNDYMARLHKLRDIRKALAKAISAGGPTDIAKEKFREKKLEQLQGELLQTEADLRRTEPELQMHKAREGEQKKARIDELKEQAEFKRQLKKVLEGEIERLEKEFVVVKPIGDLDDDFIIDLRQLEAGLARVTEEIDRLMVELTRPPRVRLLEEAVAREEKTG